MAQQSLPVKTTAATAGAELPTLKAFLEEAPPFDTQKVQANVVRNDRQLRWELRLSDLSLYCASPHCDGTRFFDPEGSSEITLDSSAEPKRTIRVTFVHYSCRHCGATSKIYALRVTTPGGPTSTVQVMKFGEDPPAIGPTPRALKALLDDEWSLFLQGRKSELAGLGIGALVYYRRVVEHVWQRVLARLIEVARLDGSGERVTALTTAQAEPKFTRSIEAAKGFVPTSLYVDGHNPFQALYDACGDGLHEYTDAECIARSRMIRLVLTRFTERAKAVLGEDAEFRQALGSLAAGKANE
jgi:hypothetical protein